MFFPDKWPKWSVEPVSDEPDCRVLPDLKDMDIVQFWDLAPLFKSGTDVPQLDTVALTYSLSESGWKQLPESVRKAMTEWADEAQPLVRDALKEQTPVRSGRMKGSERSMRTFHGDSLRIEFTANTPYARYPIWGTRPHIIKPKAARALHWVDGGGSHFARIVHHPGNRANDFPKRVMAELSDEIKTLLAAKIEAALSGRE